MNLSEILKDLRIESNLTQKELAAKLKIGQSTIVGYEKGEREPTVTNLSLYADFFEVSLDFLTGRENEYGARTATTAAPMGENMTTEERKLVEQYRQLPEQLKKLVRQQLDIYTTPSELLPKNTKKV